MTEHLKDYYKEQAKKYLSIEITVTTLHPLNKIYMQTELDFYIFFFYFFYLKKFENFVI